MREFLASTLAASFVLIVFSWVIYVPWFQRLLERRDPVGHERIRNWRMGSSVDALRACRYFLRREYRPSVDGSIHRHGTILRWTYSFPLMLGVLTLLVALAAEGFGWLDFNPRP